MDKLQRHFLKVQEYFTARKPLFERKLAQWQGRRRQALYKQAKLLFDDAIACEKEILSVFEHTDWKYNRAFLKVKIHAFEELNRELMLLVRPWWRRLIEATIVIGFIVLLLRNFFFGLYHVPTGSSEPTLLVGDRVWVSKYVYLLGEPQAGDIIMFDDPMFEYSNHTAQKLWQRYVGIAIPLLGLQHGPDNMMKRVIAVPGDVIEGKIEEGKPVLYRNGKKLSEPYVNTYPLLALRKEVGLLSDDSIGFLKIPEFLKVRKKVVLYSYDPKKDFEEQPFYFIDYHDVLYNQNTGYMRMYRQQVPACSKEGKVLDMFGPFIVPKDKYWVMGDNRRHGIDSREWGYIDRSSIHGKTSFVIWSLDSEEPVWLFDFIKNPFRFFATLRWNRFLKQID